MIQHLHNHGFRFISVYYSDNIHNIKTCRGVISGLLYCLSHFLQHAKIIYTQILLCNFQPFILYYICVFYCRYCNCIIFHANNNEKITCHAKRQLYIYNIKIDTLTDEQCACQQDASIDTRKTDTRPLINDPGG